MKLQAVAHVEHTHIEAPEFPNGAAAADEFDRLARRGQADAA